MGAVAAIGGLVFGLVGAAQPQKSGGAQFGLDCVDRITVLIDIIGRPVLLGMPQRICPARSWLRT